MAQSGREKQQHVHITVPSWRKTSKLPVSKSASQFFIYSHRIRTTGCGWRRLLGPSAPAESGSVHLALTLHVFIATDKIPLSILFSRLNSPRFSWWERMLKSHHHFCGPMSLICWGAQNRTQNSKCGLTSAEHWEGSPPSICWQRSSCSSRHH